MAIDEDSVSRAAEILSSRLHVHIHKMLMAEFCAHDNPSGSRLNDFVVRIGKAMYGEIMAINLEQQKDSPAVDVKHLRIAQVKVVSAMMLDEHGNPTGELCDVIDNSGCCFDSNLEGKHLFAQNTDAGDVAQWTVISITC